MASNVELKIHHVQGPVIAFSLNFDLYFLRTHPVPQIFDANLTPHVIANIDNWFQAKTQQRYSYRGFLDMMGAFAEGLKHTYSGQDLEHICRHAALAAKNFVLTERLGDYSKLYWVEVLDPIKLETVHAPAVRDKFEHLRAKLGDEEFFNNLCRLWKFASRHRPGLAAVFERLIQRLGRLPQEPRYPTTDDLDKDLQRAVLVTVLERGAAVYKGVPADIQEKMGILLHVERNLAVQT